MYKVLRIYDMMSVTDNMVIIYQGWYPDPFIIRQSHVLKSDWIYRGYEIEIVNE
jgi:hypothetical protein